MRDLRVHQSMYLLMWMLSPHTPVPVTTEWLAVHSAVGVGTIRKAGKHMVNLGLLQRLERNGATYWQIQIRARQLSLFSQMLGTGNAGMLPPVTSSDHSSVNAPIAISDTSVIPAMNADAPNGEPVDNFVDNFVGHDNFCNTPVAKIATLVEGDNFCNAPSKKDRKIERKDKYIDKSNLSISLSGKEGDNFCHTPTSLFAESIGISDFEELADCPLPYALAHWWYTQTGGAWTHPQGYVFRWTKKQKLAKRSVIKPFYDLAAVWAGMSAEDRAYVQEVVTGKWDGGYSQASRSVADMKFHFGDDFYPDVPVGVWGLVLKLKDVLFLNEVKNV